MSRYCDCPADGAFYCRACAALAARAGLALPTQTSPRMGREAPRIAQEAFGGAGDTSAGGMADDAPEGVLLARVRQLAKMYAWELYHTYRSTRSEPGFPDTVLTDGTDVLMMELKTNTGKATAEQSRWLSLLAHTGKVECGIWRPRDALAIEARLSRRMP
jgi:hypothetical protein